jgi:hypothetical protein
MDINARWTKRRKIGRRDSRWPVRLATASCRRASAATRELLDRMVKPGQTKNCYGFHPDEDCCGCGEQRLSVKQNALDPYTPFICFDA